MRWLKEGVDANRSANQSVQPLAFPEPKASQDGVSVQGLDNLQRIASVWLVNVEEATTPRYSKYGPFTVGGEGRWVPSYNWKIF